MTRDAEHTPSQSVVVPVEPTEAMLRRGAQEYAMTRQRPCQTGEDDVRDVWSAIIGTGRYSYVVDADISPAAPAPSSLAGGEEREVAARVLAEMRGHVECPHPSDYAEADAIVAALSPEAPAREGEGGAVELPYQRTFNAISDAVRVEWTNTEGVKPRHGISISVEAFQKSFNASAPRHEAPAEGAGEEDGAWIVHYEDRDREQEVFVGFGAREAAQRRYDQITVSWNAHLFERVKSALPLRGSAPEAREGEAVDDRLHSAIKKLKAHVAAIQAGKRNLSNVIDGPNPILSCVNELPAIIRQLDVAELEIEAAFERYEDHPAAPSADKLRIAVEAMLPVARSNTRIGKAGAELRAHLDAIDQALAALKAGAK